MKYGVNARTIWDCDMKYKEQGIAGFIPQTRYQCYSSKFKLKCVDLYISGEMYISEIVSKYMLSDTATLKLCILFYNANRELKDYNHKSGDLYGKWPLKNAKKSSNIVLDIIVVIKKLLASTMFHISQSILR